MIKGSLTAEQIDLSANRSRPNTTDTNNQSITNYIPPVEDEELKSMDSRKFHDARGSESKARRRSFRGGQVKTMIQLTFKNVIIHT